jgi:NAD(P)-dependent dehydrogenase (short-subunit alcohol dehydrogenase family)
MANVLVTGCSSGFGLLTARKFARAGHQVYATMRDLARAGDLEAARDAEDLPITILRLDVRDGASIEAAVGKALRAGPIDVLVNNAGYALMGPVEEAAEDEILAQFDTNVFGLVRVIRAVLPGMRQRTTGTIVNVSSAGVYITLPFSGFYVGSKAAVSALSEALCQELRPFGVRVVLVEPGGFATRFGANMPSTRQTDVDSPYYPTLERIAAAIRARTTSVPPGAHGPEHVADVIYDAVMGDRRQLRYVIPSKITPAGVGLDAVASQLATMYQAGEYVTLADALGGLIGTRVTPGEAPDGASPAVQRHGPASASHKVTA